MANRFLNNITINDQYTFPSLDGADGQILSTTGAANGTTELQFIDQDSLSAGSSESTHILVKNKSGAQIAKGTPVYVTGETGNSGKIEIAPADAADEDKMPALGLLETTLNDNEEGFCVQGGLLEALATATIDGTSTTANDTVYVKAGGGLTTTKPTGANFIQNIAKVARVHASNGSLVVSSILRANDVPTPLYIDHVNQRLGIGATIPTSQLSNTNINSTDQAGIGHSSTALAWRSGNQGYVATFDNYLDSTISNGLLVKTSNTGTASYIAKFESGGVNKMLIRSDGNVGIGTDSPGKLLELKGGDNEAVLRLFNDQANTWDIQNSTLGKLDFIRGGSNTYMRIDQNGNVGINQTNPGGKLEVRQAANNGTLTAFTSPHIKLTASATADNQGFVGITAATSTADNYGYSFGAQRTSGGVGDFKINYHNNSAAGANRFLIDQNGNVGIGTTNPDSKLHVSGAIQNDQFIIPNTAGSNGQVLAWPTTGTTLEWVDQSASGGGIAGTIAANQVAYGTALDTIGGHSGLTYDGNGILSATQIDCTTSLYVADNIFHRSDANTSINFSTDQINLYSGGLKMFSCIESTADEVVINDDSRDINFRVESDLDTHMFFVDADLNRVGIGTNNPGEKLSVVPDTDVSAEIGKAHIGQVGFNDYAGFSHVDQNTQQGYALIQYSDGSTYMNANTGKNIRFRIANSDKMILNSSGNVGIGTTSPLQKLHVSSDDQSTARIRLSNTNTTSGGDNIDLVAGIHNVGQDGFSIYNATSSQTQFVILGSGNVGIGTTSPQAKLDITGATNSTKSLGLRSGNSGTQTGAAQIVFSYNGNPWNSSGYSHSIRTTHDSTNESGNRIHFYLWDPLNDTSSTLGSKNVMSIIGNGNVGIGTTGPSQKLHVNGSALVSSNLYISSTSYYLNIYFGRIDLNATNGVAVRSGTTYKPVYASAFNVVSDYRLKSNIVPLENAISRVNQLEVHRFNWNDRLNEPKVDGFIAHEVAPIIPEAVLGEKDAVHEDGTPNHQGIDQAKIVPLLTAALQEAIAKIESLESRIQTLENQ